MRQVFGGELLMDVKWCCGAFESHARAEGSEDGVRVALIKTRRPALECYLEIRPKLSLPSEPFETGVQIKFCPWCGADLKRRYGVATH